MIVFAASITSPETYESCAEPGIRLAAEPDSQVFAYQAAGSIFRSYNLILDRAAALDDLEALVLVHQDAEIADPEFCPKLRRALADPEVGVVGCVGAVGVRNIAWWEGSVTWGSFTHRYQEMGGGDLPALSWEAEGLPSFAHTGEVDTVDGFVLAVSPWTARNVRFDESLGQLHGYDFDFCLQVREAGKKIVATDLKVVHHHSLELLGDPDAWVQSYVRLTEKWEGRAHQIPSFEGDWKLRAYRAEAEAAAARTQRIQTQWQANARESALRNEIETMRGSTSWRVTEPLRRLGQIARRPRGG